MCRTGRCGAVLRLIVSSIFLLLSICWFLTAGEVSISGVDFVNAYNLQSMAIQIPELGLLAIGVTLAMISGNGGIDLSGIALANLSGITAALLVPQFISPDDSPMTYVFVFGFVCLCVGFIGGVVNGLLVSRANLTPIIATLGTSLAFTGVSVVLTNGSGVRLGYIEPLDAFGHSPIMGVPMCFALFLVIAIIIGMVFALYALRHPSLFTGKQPQSCALCWL